MLASLGLGMPWSNIISWTSVGERGSVTTSVPGGSKTVSPATTVNTLPGGLGISNSPSACVTDVSSGFAHTWPSPPVLPSGIPMYPVPACMTFMFKTPICIFPSGSVYSPITGSTTAPCPFPHVSMTTALTSLS